MAVNQRAYSEFNDILSSLDRKFEIIHVKWSEDKFFEAKFRTQIQRNSDDFNALCDEWVDLFSETTNTVWVKKISNTGPKIRFRKQYQCWTQGGKEVQKELLFDARRCKGTLDVKVLTDNPLTRRKNKHIRMGLNVVVKINFTHLHKVDINQPFSFFVHSCEPLPELPKPIIQPNDKLPKLVAEMVQKGLNASPKIVNTNNMRTNDIQQQQQQLPQQQLQQNQHQSVQLHLQQHQLHPKNMTLHTTTLHSNKLLPNDILQKSLQITDNMDQKLIENSDHMIQNQIHIPNLEQATLQLNHVVPLQGMETIKLQVQPQLQQLTQVVVSAPQLDLNEPLLMCQPTLMFDPSQVIPVSTLPHFVQVHSHNLHSQQGHFL